MPTTTDQTRGRGPDNFVPTDELVRRSGMRPFTSIDDHAPRTDPFESDGEYAEFLADLYTSRDAGRR